MCLTIEKPRECFFSFDHEQYDKEVALMRKRIQNLLIKVEENPLDNSYNRFKESLKRNNHENLKK